MSKLADEAGDLQQDLIAVLRQHHLLPRSCRS